MSRLAGSPGLQSRLVLMLALLLVGCAGADEPDAYGNVEATDVLVSAEVAGRLMTFEVDEGQQLDAGAIVGTIDAEPLTLQRTQAEAQRAATASRATEVARQVPVLEAQRAAAEAQRAAADAQRSGLESQLEIARRNLERTRRLREQEAATAQQLDQAERDVRVLEEQVRAQGQQVEAQVRQVAAYEAQIEAVRAQRQTAAQQVASAEAQVAQIDDRIRRSEVRNPSAGTVLATFAEPGELVQAGQPLYRIADLGTVDVRAYVGEAQLSGIRVGQSVQVSFDAGGNARQSLDGTITRIADQAEFTPTPIQTRDERTDLVYAITVRVANPERRLKIGMPVDVDFADGQ
ncbi:MAG: HlyD family secretion protein [Vicinamibacterales bacterium]